MDAAVERLLGLGALAFAMMLAVYEPARVPEAPTDPWAPQPTVRVATFHGSIPDEVEDITGDARHVLGRMFGLKPRVR